MPVSCVTDGEQMKGRSLGISSLLCTHCRCSVEGWLPDLRMEMKQTPSVVQLELALQRSQ